MLTVVTFKYAPVHSYRTRYDATHVNRLARNVARHYPHEHRFVCITDDPHGMDCETQRMNTQWLDVPNPSNSATGNTRPCCYPRLLLFSDPGFYDLGERFVCLDLDVVLVADPSPLWHRSEDFIIYNPKDGNEYNGSMFLLRQGARPTVYSAFDPGRDPARTHASGFRGSDQAWLRYHLGPGEAQWGPADGVYAFRSHIERRAKRHNVPRPHRQPPQPLLPGNARVVTFAGRHKPWDSNVIKNHPWIREHYL